MRRTYAACTLLAALVLLAAACSPDQPAGDETGLPGEEGELAHAQCMRDHGIDWPDPEFVDGEWEIRLGDEIDLESPAFKEAEAECAQVRQDAQPDAGDVDDPAERAQLEDEMDRMLTFAACMRDQGIDFPDPQMDDGGTISGPAGPLDGDWDAFDAAKQACEDETGEPMP
jgi:hypothetical protein